MTLNTPLQPLPPSSGWVIAAAIGLAIVAFGVVIKANQWTIGVAPIGHAFGVQPEDAAEILGTALHRFGLVLIGFAVLVPAGFEPDLVAIVFLMAIGVVAVKTIRRFQRVARTYS